MYFIAFCNPDFTNLNDLTELIDCSLFYVSIYGIMVFNSEWNDFICFVWDSKLQLLLLYSSNL